MARKPVAHGSVGYQDVRYFPASEKQRLKDIRSGQGPATKALASGSTAPSVKKEALAEANAQQGGALPASMFDRATKRSKK